MTKNDRPVLPAAVLLVFFASLPLAGVMGVMHGVGVLSGEALTWAVLSAITVFVPWAVCRSV
jgi:hypothetical protein